MFYHSKHNDINKINLAGSRLSGKTFNVSHFSVKQVLTAMKTGKILGFFIMRMIGGNNLLELADEVQYQLDVKGMIESKKKIGKELTPGAHYRYTCRNGIPLFEFRGGSKIEIRGLYTQNNDRSALKGTSSFASDLTIEFFEEASEMGKKEFQSADFAFRGYKRLLRIKACNPDNDGDYIEYLKKHCPFDKDKLERDGYQYEEV